MLNLVKRTLSITFVSLFVAVLMYAQSGGDVVLVNNQISEALQISFAPQAVYTSTARKQGLEGKVVLKITFLANGELGEIVDVTKEKRAEMISYGLTAQAFKAAKKIKFTPVKRNGVPRSVIKAVEYVFSLY